MKQGSDPLRVMRDQVYGQRSTDNNWEHCVERWEADKVWLVRTYNDLPKPLPKHDSLPWPKIQ